MSVVGLKKLSNNVPSLDEWICVTNEFQIQSLEEMKSWPL